MRTRPTNTGDLVVDLGSPKKKSRLRAAESLAGGDHPDAVSLLVELVTSDPDAAVRRAAAVALIGAPRTATQRDALITVMRDTDNDKRLRRNAALALTVPPDPVATAAVERILADALLAEAPFGIGPSLDVSPTTRRWSGPRRAALEAATGSDTMLFAAQLSDTLICAALDDRWVVLTDPKNPFTGLQDGHGRAIKVFTVPYVDSLPLERQGGSSGRVAFLRGSTSLQFSGFDVDKFALAQAEPFFAWLDRTRGPKLTAS